MTTKTTTPRTILSDEERYRLSKTFDEPIGLFYDAWMAEIERRETRIKLLEARVAELEAQLVSTATA